MRMMTTRGWVCSLWAAGLVAGLAQAQTTNDWILNANGTWSNTASWSSATVPNAAGSMARLTNGITAGRTVYINSAVTLGELWVGASTANAFTLQNTNNATFTLNNNGAGAWIRKFTGSATDLLNTAFVLADNLNITNAATGGLTLNSNITESVAGRSLTLWAGTATLSGSNSFTGGTVLNGGTLILGNNYALGSGVFTINGGKINVTAARTNLYNAAMNWNGDFEFVGASSLLLGGGAVTLGGNRQVTVTASTLTVGGAVGDGGNAYSLTKLGSGTLVLGATNTYTGQTVINGGVLRIMDSRWLNVSSNLLLNGGVLEIVSNDFTRTLGLGTGSSQVQILGGASGFSVNGNGARAVQLGASSSTVLKWDSAYFSPSTLILQASNANQNLTLNNILDLNGATRTIEVQANVAMLASITNTTGAAALVKKGAGDLYITQGSGNYPGLAVPLTVNNGSVRVAWSNAIASTVPITLDGGQLSFLPNLNRSTFQNPTLGTGAGQVAMSNNAGFASAGGKVSIQVTENGGTTLTWGAGNLGTLGELLLQSATVSGSALLVLNNNLDFNGASRTVTVAAGYAVIGGTVNNSGAPGAGLVKSGAGNLYVWDNNFQEDGPTTIANGMIYLGNYFYATGTLPGSLGNAGTITNSSTGTLVIANPGDTTLSGKITGAGALTMNGRGTLTLTGTNNYTGATTLQRGGIKLDFSAANAPATNIIGTGLGALNLVSTSGNPGGTLTLQGAANVTNYQGFGNVPVGAGAFAIVGQSGAGGALNVLFSNLTRSANNGVVDFTLPANGQFLTKNTNVNGILNGAFTVGGVDWAASNSVNGAGLAVLSNYNGYTVVSAGNIGDGAAQNIQVQGNVGLAAATTTINTLALTNAAGNYTITLGGQTLRLGTTGGILVPPSAGALTIGSTVGDGVLTAGGAANTAGDLIFINNSLANPLTVNANIGLNGTGVPTLTKGGNGALNIAGNILTAGTLRAYAGLTTLSGTNKLGSVNVFGGNLTFAESSSNYMASGGTLILNDGTVRINGPLTLAGTDEIQLNTVGGARSVLYIATNVVANRIRSSGSGSDNGYAAGAIFQTGGNVASYASGNGLTVVDATMASGYYSLMGGTVTADVVVAYRGYGVLDVGNGGTLTASNAFKLVTDNSGSALLNIYAGGVVNAPTNGSQIAMNAGNWQGGRSVLTVLGGTLNLANGGTGKGLDMMNNVGNTSYLNLLGGVVTGAYVKAGLADGLSVVNFNGGTWAASASTNLLQAGLTAAYVYAGGATFDSGAFNITNTAALLAPAGYGLSTLATNASCGAQYISPPIVEITGGSGTGALALAELDFATGTITNFRVVNPGSGYQASDVLTVTLQGGGPLVASSSFSVSGASLTPSASGGLTKLGSGTLVLTTSNTFAGDTTVGAGALLLNNRLALGNSAVALSSAGGALQFGSGSTAYQLGGLKGDGNLALTNSGNLGVTLVLSNAADLVYSGVLADNGRTGAVIKTGSGRLTLAGANTYGGGTTLSNGTVQLSGAGTLGSSTGALTNNGAVLDLNGVSLGVGNFAGSGGLVTNAGGSPATFTIGNGNGNGGTFAGAIGDNAAGGGTLALTKTGTGILALSGANTYSGKTTVKGGVLSVAGSGSLPGWNVAGLVAVSNGAALAVGNSMLDADIATLLLRGNFAAGASVGFDTTDGDRLYTPALANTAAGALGLFKIGANTLTLSGPNTYTGGTTILGGTLAVGAQDTLPVTGAVVLGDTNGYTGSLLLNAYNQTIGSLTVRANSLNTNLITINSGYTLTLSNNTTGAAFTAGNFGSSVSNPVTQKIVFTGGGALNVAAPAGSFLVEMNGINSPNTGVLDLSGLSSFNATVNNFYVTRTGATLNNPTITFTLSLATNSTITATNILLAVAGMGSGTDAIHLGQNSVLNANTIVMGGGRQALTTDFLGMPSPLLTIRGVDGGETRANLSIGDNAEYVGGSTTASGLLDLSAGTANLRLERLLLGYGGQGVSTTLRALATGTMIFGGASSTVDVNTAIIGCASNFSGITYSRLTSQGSLVMSNGVLNVNRSMVLGQDEQASGSYSQFVSGAFAIYGGSAVVSNGITLGHHTDVAPDTATATGAVTIAGGTLLVTGDITNGVGNTFGSLTLAGTGTLDLQGHAIGSAVKSVDAVTFQSGTLMNLGQLNNGAPLVKTNSGTLILAGLNSYSGGTTSAAGTLAVGGDNVLGTGTLWLNGGTLGVSGGSWAQSNAVTLLASSALDTTGGDLTLSGPVSVNATSTLTKNGANTLTLSGANTILGTILQNAGTLHNSGTLSAGTNIQVKFNSIFTNSGTLAFTGGKLQIYNSAVVENSGSISNNSGIVLCESGNPTNTVLNNAAGGSIYMGAGSFYGGIYGTGTVNNLGTITLAGSARMLLGGGNVDGGYTNAFATLNLNGGALNFSSSSTFVLGNTDTNSTGVLNLNGGTLSINRMLTRGTGPGARGYVNFNGGTLAGTSNGVTLLDTTMTLVTVQSNGANLELAAGLTNFISASLHDGGGNGGLTKLGAGTLTLSGANDYTGGTTISNGVLRIASAAALPADRAVNIVNLNATLDLGLTPASISTLNGLGGLINGGGLTVQDGRFGGTISGAGGLTKIGAGTLDFHGTAAFAGPTVVSNGTLSANADLPGLINVYGGTLGGTGTLGTVQLYTGGTYGPGNSPGLQVISNLTLSGGTFSAELVNSNSYDRLIIANSLTFSAGATNYLSLTLTNFTLEAHAQYLLVRNDSLTPWDPTQLFFLNDLGLDNGRVLSNGVTFQALGGGSSTNFFSIQYDFAATGGVGNDILLTVIPEPASVNLLLIFGAAYWLRSRLYRQRGTRS